MTRANGLALHARLTEILAKEGARVIAFDVFFDEAKSVEEESLFSDAIQKAGNVVLCEILDLEKVSLPDKQSDHPGDLTIVKLVPPIPSLAQSAVALAPFPLPKVPVRSANTGPSRQQQETHHSARRSLSNLCVEIYDELLGLLKRIDPVRPRICPSQGGGH
jgi:adenylate cyclase